MVSENRNTHSVQQKPYPPIRYTPHQVALMAQYANSFGDDFARAINLHTAAFAQRPIDWLIENPTPTIPFVVQRYFSLRPNRKGGFTWIPR